MDDPGGDAVADRDRWKRLASLFSGVAHPIRVAILESLQTQAGRPLTEVADEFDVSRSAVQKHVNRLEDADLVYRPEDADRNYALSPLGRYFAHLVIREGHGLAEAVHHVEEAETHARDEFDTVPLGDTALEKAVTNRKWELVGDDLVRELIDAEPTPDTGNED